MPRSPDDKPLHMPNLPVSVVMPKSFDPSPGNSIPVIVGLCQNVLLNRLSVVFIQNSIVKTFELYKTEAGTAAKFEVPLKFTSVPLPGLCAVESNNCVT